VRLHRVWWVLTSTIVRSPRRSLTLSLSLALRARSPDDLGSSGEPISLVDPNYIMSLPLFKQFQKNCQINSTSTGCPGIDSTGVCKAIASNKIYGGQYDLVSTFAVTPVLGGFSRTCEKGQYAQCMTAACYQREAFDGSPVTCYCPIYETSGTYIVGTERRPRSRAATFAHSRFARSSGGPSGSSPPCKQRGGFLLSGVKG